MSKKVIWSLIILIALLVRTYDLPHGLHFFESTIGWRAQNLLNFGKDEFGRALPIIFSNWQKIELPLPTYLTLPFVLIDKTNPFLLRFPFALLGTLSVFAGMLLSKKLFPERKHLDLYTGLFLAISPGLIGQSRTTSPELVFFTLTLWGLLFIINKGKYSYFGSCLLFLSFFTSDISLFVLPVLFLVLILLGVEKKKILIAAIGFPISLLLLLSASGGLESLINNNFSLLQNRGILDDVNKIRGEELARGSPFFAKIFFNKLFYIIKISENFLSHINPSFIFAKGDGNPLNGNSNFGPMLVVTLPLFILGLFRIPKNKHFLLLASIFILSAIASLFMLSAPYTNRFLLALFPLTLIAGYGLTLVPKRFVPIVLFAVFFNFSVVLYDGIFKEKERGKKTWNPETYNLALKLKGEYSGKKIWVTDKIDPNPGPTIAYVAQVPYTDTNLAKEKNIYRAWVSKIKDIDIGNIASYSQDSQNFNLVLISKEDIPTIKDQKIFSCKWDEIEKDLSANVYLKCI